MTEQYRITKSDDQCKPVKEFSKFPADGIWVVKDAGKKSQLIMRLPHEPISTSMITRKALVKLSLKEKILEALLDETRMTRDFDELADDIVEKLLEENGK